MNTLSQTPQLKRGTELPTTSRTTSVGGVVCGLLRRATHHVHHVGASEKTQPRTTNHVNPFKASYRERLRKLGGKYRPTSITDANQRQFIAEEVGVSMARDVKLGTIEEVAPW
ncbi:hypothetical protein [Aeoliella sp. SH292]|uniref:hypothetical protein n=1 Tax=Aeoliella sp. SH292 TaxID=3454464 RepID=UPI003F96EA6E